MGVPHTLNDSLRAHDTAIMNWLQGCRVNYGMIAGANRDNFPIISVFASPDRAFAETANTLIRTGWIAGDTQAAQEYNAKYENWPVFPLPIISVVRQDPMFEVDLAGVPKFIAREYVDPVTGAFLPYQWPARYRTTYRVTVWSLKRATQAFVLEWFYSQFGQVGMGNREVLLDVDQGPPFGIVKAPLRFDSSIDLSDLEGDSQRYIRSELALALRMNVFRESPDVVIPRTADPVYSIQLQNQMVRAFPRDAELETEFYPDSGIHTTNNLFTFGGWDSQISALWPVEGAATVTRSYDADPSDALGLDVGVDAAIDVVPLACRINVPLPELGGLSIWMVAMRYMSDGPWSLIARQYDADDVETTLLSYTYAANPVLERWRDVQAFALSNQAKMEWAVGGAGSPANLTVSSVDIRMCSSAPAVVPSAYGISGPDRFYNWTNLQARPYLVICQFPTGPLVPGTVELDNDLSAPSLTSTQPFLAQTVGSALLVMPLNSSLTLRIPSAIAPLAVYALAFDGPALPNSIQP